MCDIGYTGQVTACVDKNECEQFPCHKNATCLNLVGSYSCICNDGLTGDGFTCSGVFKDYFLSSRNVTGIFA